MSDYLAPKTIYQQASSVSSFHDSPIIAEFTATTLPHMSASAVNALKPAFEILLGRSLSAAEDDAIDRFAKEYAAAFPAESTITQHATSHSYAHALMILHRNVNRALQIHVLQAFQSLCGYQTLHWPIESTSHYYRQVLACRDVLIEFIESTECPQTQTTLNQFLRDFNGWLTDRVTEDGHLTNEKPTTAAIKRVAVLGLLTGEHRLGIPRVDRASNQSDDDLNLIDSENCFQPDQFEQALDNIYSPKPRLPSDPPKERETKPESAKSEPKNRKQTARLLEQDDAKEAANLAAIAKGEKTRDMAALTLKYPEIVGSDEAIVRWRYTGMFKSFAKRNNPSLSQRNVHSVLVLLNQLNWIKTADGTLASILTLSATTGLAPQRFNSLLKVDAQESDIRFDSTLGMLTYLVHGHQKNPKESREDVQDGESVEQWLTLLLPPNLAYSLESFVREEKSVDRHYHSVAKRYKTETGHSLIRLSQWAASSPGIIGPYMRPFDQGLLAGRLHLTYFVESYYTQSEVAQLNRQYHSALDEFLGLEYGVEPEGNDNSQCVVVSDQLLPSGTLGSPWPSTAHQLSNLILRISERRHLLGRRWTKATFSERLPIAIEITNLINLSYSIIISIVMVSRPHWQRMINIETSEGIYLEDKDNKHYREGRLIAPFNREEWQKETTLLHQQRAEANKALSWLASVCGPRRIKIKRKIQPLREIENSFEPCFVRMNDSGELNIEPYSQVAFEAVASTLVAAGEIPKQNLPRHVHASRRSRIEKLGERESDDTVLLTEQRNLMSHLTAGLGLFTAQSSSVTGISGCAALVQELLNTFQPVVIKVPGNVRIE